MSSIDRVEFKLIAIYLSIHIHRDISLYAHRAAPYPSIHPLQHPPLAALPLNLGLVLGRSPPCSTFILYPPPPPKNLIPAPCLVVDSIRCDLSPLALLSFKFVLYTPTRPNLPSIRRLKISSSHPHQTLHHIPHHLPSLRLTILPGALQ